MEWMTFWVEGGSASLDVAAWLKRAALSGTALVVAAVEVAHDDLDARTLRPARTTVSLRLVEAGRR